MTLIYSAVEKKWTGAATPHAQACFQEGQGRWLQMAAGTSNDNLDIR